MLLSDKQEKNEQYWYGVLSSQNDGKPEMPLLPHSLGILKKRKHYAGRGGGGGGEGVPRQVFWYGSEATSP